MTLGKIAHAPIYLPILLTVTGSALAIFSAIISGFLSSDIEQAISDKEDEVVLLHMRLTGAHEHIQRSYQTFNSPDVKLLIVQSSEKKEVPAHVFQEIAKGIINQGVRVLEFCFVDFCGERLT